MSDLTQSQSKKRFDAITRLGCIVCLTHLGTWTPCAIHHIREYGEKRKDSKTIGLCDPGHHKASGFGVHDGRETFERNFGTELELLEITNRMIGGNNGK